LRLRGDIKGNPHVVNGKCFKHYIAGEKFMGNVEKWILTSPEKE
jgi:hypothetical protein